MTHVYSPLDDFFGPPIATAAALPVPDSAWDDALSTSSSVLHRPRPRCLPENAEMVRPEHAPHLDYSAVCDIWDAPDAFVRICKIISEDQSESFLVPTPAQMQVIEAYHAHRWVMVTKYRQAKVSTVSLMLLLRDCMYLHGVEGRIVAEKTKTAVNLMRRLKLAYYGLPAHLRVPLAKGTEFSSEKVEFAHGGSIQLITAMSESPGVGQSIDRLIVTEFGEVSGTFQANMLANLFPTISKRPNARFVLETTPGKAGTQHEKIWQNTIAGQSRFFGLFLRWWLDDSCTVPTDSDRFRRSEEEQDFAKRHPGITDEHLMFRRESLSTEFAAAPQKFPSKYPSHEGDGWLGSASQTIPADLLDPFWSTVRADADVRTHPCGLRILYPPVPGRKYIVVGDPGRFADKGDYSSAHAFDTVTGVEVASWEGREDPVRFADRLASAGHHYNNAMIAPEANADGCVAVLVKMGYPNLYYRKRVPGWYASAKTIREGEAHLITMLRSGQITISFLGTLQQLSAFDGSEKAARIRDEEGNTSHFERARCVLMVAYILATRRFFNATAQDENTEAVVMTEETRPRGIPLARLSPTRRPVPLSPYQPYRSRGTR